MAEGGVVRQPTLALVGERGPEAIVPLGRFQGAGGVGGRINVFVELDGRTIGRASAPHIADEIRVRTGNRR
jgi:hypothetical protein